MLEQKFHVSKNKKNVDNEFLLIVTIKSGSITLINGQGGGGTTL